MSSSLQQGRAGQYVRQPSGYRAFEPAPLPPQPGLRFDASLQNRLSQADRALGRLDGSVQTLPDADLFVLMYIRKEAVLSSQIEGTQSSLADVLEAEAQIYDPARPSDVGEVLNYIAAMRHGLRRLETLPVSTRLVREIHELLLAGVRGAERRPGEIRTSQNWIGPAGCTLNDATFVPPPPHLVLQCLSDWEQFVHMNDELPVLIRIGLAHAQFETVHPFLDGNGRIGRLLITFLLCEQNILQEPVLYLSHYFKQHRTEYYDRLQAVRDTGDWEGWIGFFLNGLATVADEATTTARRIVELRERDRARIVQHFGRGASNALTVLEHLYTNPIIRVADAEKVTGLTFAAANQLVHRLTSQGLLVEATGNARNRQFRYQEYVDLFLGG